MVGFHFDNLQPYAIKIGAVKENLFFSCRVKNKTGDFYVEMDTGKVHLIATKDW